MSTGPSIWTHIGIDRRDHSRRSSQKDAGKTKKPGVLARVWQQARPCWPHLAGILFLTLLSTPFALLLPLPLKLVVDNVIGKQPLPRVLQPWIPAWITQSSGMMLVLAAGTLLAIGLLMQLQSLASWLLQTYTGEKLVMEFRAGLFAHVQRLNLAFHDRKGTSDTVYRIQHDAPSIQLITIQGFLPFVSSTFAFAGMAIVTWRMDWKLSLIAFALSPPLFWLARASSRKVHEGWHEVKEMDSSAMSVLEEVLGSMRLVKAFGRERDEDIRFVTRSNQRMWGQIRLAFVQAGYHCATGLLIAVGTGAALLVGALHVRSGVLTLGELLIVMAYMGQLYEPLRTMSTKLPELQSWMVSVERALMLLDEAEEPLQSPTAQAIEKVTGRIEFQKVSFAYPNGHRVFEDVSFVIEPGRRVGIVGPTGSGKSTLVSLLLRFYDPSGGRILLDGVDLREYRLQDLRNQFAIVPQEPVLFSTSIAENIAFARPSAQEHEVVAAAVAANAQDFIERLPAQYENEVGDRGALLSGGERQRVAIARAFLRNSPMLILDEPTSAVDLKTEAAVIAATRELMSGRTSFMIAHRLSTLEGCDVLLRFEQGKLHVIDQDVSGALRKMAGGELQVFPKVTPREAKTDATIANSTTCAEKSVVVADDTFPRNMISTGSL
jgi:ATP-binding cassette, subfamily B, bacterial